MQFHTRACSQRGSRSMNEDALSYCTDTDSGVWVVADGLGGHSFGELASKTVVDFIAEHACEAVPTGEECMALLEEANQALVDRQHTEPQHAGMRTTVVAAFAVDGILRPLNIGDSRLYYFRDKALFYQTKDHSLSQLAVDSGEITSEGIRFHEDRNALTKVLGFEGPLGVKQVPPEIVVQAGDAFLLCTDGFWEYVLETEMESSLAEAADTAAWLDKMLAYHAARVLEKEMGAGNDNYTAVCCMVSA